MSDTNEEAQVRAPFPGLRPFEDKDEYLFFGRDEQVDALLERLQHLHFVAVVGTSASGKSSLVRAGLLPALHGGFMASAGSRWRIATLRPESDPIGSLAAALERAGALGGEADPQLRAGLARAVLERGALGLVEIVRQSRRDAAENVLIFVDQFEELFRYKRAAANSAGADESAAFVKLLLAAAAQVDAGVYVLITMRSDFLGDCSQFAGLPEAINEGLFLVPRLTREQVREAIEGPIAVEQAEIAPRLVNRLLGDLADDPDQLPVLQHALMRTWDTWAAKNNHDVPLDLEDYEATGGLAEALSRHGDEIFTSLPSDRSRLAAERIFKALTDAGTDNRGIRRPTSFGALLGIAGVSADDARTVIDAYRARGVSFLMPPPEVALVDDTTIDITHESLMRVWQRLRGWVSDEADSARAYRRLREAAAAHARGEAGLLRDEAQLATASEWRATTAPTAAWAERYAPNFEGAMRFLDASLAARERERAERRSRLRLTIAALSIALIVFGIISALAIKGNLDANNQLLAARSERVARVDRQLYEQHAERMAEDDADSLALKRSTYLLAATAYAESPTEDANEMLLLGISHLGLGSLDITAPNLALSSIEVPEWNMGALSDRGRRLTILTGARTRLREVVKGRLISFDIRDLMIKSNVDGISSRALCGFDDAPEIATTDGSDVALYDISHDAGTLARTTPLANVVALACASARTIIAVTADGTLHRIATDGSTEVLGAIPRSDTASGIALSADNHVAGVVACAPRNKRICDATNLYLFDFSKNRATWNPTTYRDIGMDCGLFDCAASVTFDAEAVYWYDAGSLWIRRLRADASPIALPCKPSLCERASLAMVPGIFGPVVVNENKTISIYYSPTRGWDFLKRRYDKLKPTFPLPLIDTHYPIFASNDGGTFGKSVGLGLGIHSFSNFVNAPMRALVPSGTWGYALSASADDARLAVIIPRKSSIVSYDLHDQIGANSAATTPDNDSESLFEDAGDGKHGVRANLRTGAVKLFEMNDDGTKTTSSFSIDLAAYGATPAISRTLAKKPDDAATLFKQQDITPSIALDPERGMTVLSMAGIRRYALDGHELENLSWPKFLATAGLGKRGRPNGAYLSQRGNYVSLRYNKGDDALVTSDGALIGSENNITTISPDERFAITRSSSGLHELHALPRWTDPETIDITQAFLAVAVSPDSRKIAYATQLDDTDPTTHKPTKVWEIRLYDLASRHSMAASLPIPIESKSLQIQQLRFSPGGRYLIATDKINSDTWLAVYDVDARSWLRELCHETGTPLTQDVFEDMSGERGAFRDGCANLQPFALDYARK